MLTDTRRVRIAAMQMRGERMAEYGPIDVVYTWVDDTFEGYADLLRQYARTGHDTNPNRTRDNLDLLKYSLRSLERYCPWVRNVYLFTIRPQVPAWLDTNAPGLHVVHHDEVIEPRHLPTFNSFAIVSHLHLLPGLSERFLYVEDDMLFAAPVALDDLMDEAGRSWVYPHLGYTRPAAAGVTEDLSPWNASLANGNALLDGCFGHERRREVNHIPLLLQRGVWAEMQERWPEAVEVTRSSRFRGHDDISFEYLYPYYAYYTGAARMHSIATTYHRVLYHPLENILPWAWLGAALHRLWRPKFFTLNDNFDERPNPRVVAFIRRFLARAYPTPSRFERPEDSKN